MVAGTLGEPGHLGGDPQPVARGARGPDRVVLGQQAAGQRQRVAGRPGGRHGLCRERPGPGQVEPVPGQGAGQAGHDVASAAARRRVRIRARRSASDSSATTSVGRPPGAGADGVQAERGPGETAARPARPGPDQRRAGRPGPRPGPGPPAGGPRPVRAAPRCGRPAWRRRRRARAPSAGPLPRRPAGRRPPGPRPRCTPRLAPKPGRRVRSAWPVRRAGRRRRQPGWPREPGQSAGAGWPVRPRGAGRRRTRGTGRARSGRRPCRPGSLRGPGPPRRAPRPRRPAAGRIARAARSAENRWPMTAAVRSVAAAAAGKAANRSSRAWCTPGGMPSWPLLQQPGDLLHEERVAAGPAVHPGRDLGRALLSYHARDQGADRVRAEPGQRQHGGPRRQRGQRGTRRRAGTGRSR